MGFFFFFLEQLQLEYDNLVVLAVGQRSFRGSPNPKEY
jgi:hypothetical protein